MPDDERVNFNPASLLPKEIWIEPKPKNWQQPEKVYLGTGTIQQDSSFKLF